APVAASSSRSRARASAATSRSPALAAPRRFQPATGTSRSSRATLPGTARSDRSGSSSDRRARVQIVIAKDKRFLNTPPYTFELGVLVAAGALWQLLTRGAREEAEQDQVGSDAMPPERTQA